LRKEMRGEGKRERERGNGEAAGRSWRVGEFRKGRRRRRRRE
jgi:hypothetical protein